VVNNDIDYNENEFKKPLYHYTMINSLANTLYVHFEMIPL